MITDTSANIHHVAQVIRQLDVEGSKEKVLLFPLAHASAQMLSEQVLRILEKSKTTAPPTGSSPGRADDRTTDPRVLPDDRTNSLIVIATEQDAADRRPTGQAARHRAAGRHGQRPRRLSQERRRQRSVALAGTRPDQHEAGRRSVPTARRDSDHPGREHERAGDRRPASGLRGDLRRSSRSSTSCASRSWSRC